MNETLGLRALDASTLRTMTPTNTPSISSSKPDSELREAALEFESLFIKQMLKASRNTLNPEDGLIYGGQAEQIFTDMLDDEYAGMMSRVENIGLAKMLYEQLASRPWNDIA